MTIKQCHQCDLELEIENKDCPECGGPMSVTKTETKPMMEVVPPKFSARLGREVDHKGPRRQ